MSKSVKTISLGLLVLAGLCILASAADVNGTWSITTQSPRGERTSEMTIVQDGESITVTMEGFRGDEMTGEGTVKDGSIEWLVTVSTQRGDFSMSYKGTIAEDGTMSGEVSMGDFGTMEWSAVKK